MIGVLAERGGLPRVAPSGRETRRNQNTLAPRVVAPSRAPMCLSPRSDRQTPATPGPQTQHVPNSRRGHLRSFRSKLGVSALSRRQPAARAGLGNRHQKKFRKWPRRSGWQSGNSFAKTRHQVRSNDRPNVCALNAPDAKMAGGSSRGHFLSNLGNRN
jgi:hypothetical protein